MYKISTKTIGAQAWAKKFKLIIVGVVLVIGIAYFNAPLPKTVVSNSNIPFETKTVNDNSIELGEEQIRQEGENGIKEVEYSVKRTLSGKELSRHMRLERIIKAPTTKTVALGTKKFQFMWCSNGTYRYFNNEEFKNPRTGFTHKSPDSCAQNGQGHMTSIADSAPAPAPSTSYSRSYTPSYRSYSPTTCRTQYNTYGGYFDPTATTTCY
jgi:hypothetical protein